VEERTRRRRGIAPPLFQFRVGDRPVEFGRIGSVRSSARVFPLRPESSCPRTAATASSYSRIRPERPATEPQSSHFLGDKNSCRRLSMSRRFPVFESRNCQKVQPLVAGGGSLEGVASTDFRATPPAVDSVAQSSPPKQTVPLGRIDAVTRTPLYVRSNSNGAFTSPASMRNIFGFMHADMFGRS
jgi:hypothetical protein